jgi:ParB/RepB/Spo0J family partition protein
VVTGSTALLEPQEFAEAGPPEAVRLPLDLIDANPHNPRRELAEVDALADNIRSFGLLQPVTVRRIGDRYELLGGHRRRAAFELLREREPHDVQWSTLPAVIRSADDDDRAYLMLLSGQLHNRTWRPREEAAALERLVLSGRTLVQIGQALHRTESWASKRLRVYADAVLSGYVQTGTLSTGVAEELLVIKDAKTRKAFAERAVAESWSQDHARGEARSLRVDRVIREVGRRSRELLEALSVIDAPRLPAGMARDLWQLHNRIEILARGGKPVFPTIEAAQKAAGVREQQKPQRGKRKPGYKPRALAK